MYLEYDLADDGIINLGKPVYMVGRFLGRHEISTDYALDAVWMDIARRRDNQERAYFVGVLDTGEDNLPDDSNPMPSLLWGK